MKFPKELEGFEKRHALTLCTTEFTATWCYEPGLSSGMTRQSFPFVTPIATITGNNETQFRQSLEPWDDCHCPHMVHINGSMDAFNWLAGQSRIAGFGVIMDMSLWDIVTIKNNLPRLTTITTRTAGMEIVGRRPFPVTAHISTSQENFTGAFGFLIKSLEDQSPAGNCLTTDASYKAEVDVVLISLTGTNEQMRNALALVKKANGGDNANPQRSHHKLIGLVLSNAFLQVVESQGGLGALLAGSKPNIICFDTLYNGE